MATKLNKYTDRQIAAVLDTESDSDTQNSTLTKDVRNELQRKRSSKLHSRKRNDSDVSTDDGNARGTFEYACRKDCKERILQEEKTSFKIKLRRSTEQSLYKIDTDSECEKSGRRKRVGRSLQQKRMSYSDVESEGSCTDNKSSADSTNTMRCKKELRQLEINDNVLSTPRARKPPSRLSLYHCGSLSSLNHMDNTQINSPSLRRNRKKINYNEDKLILNVIKANIELDNKKSKQKENKDSNVFTVKNKTESEKLRSNARNNKRNRMPSVNDSENDGSIDSKIIKTKSMRKSNESECSTNNDLNNSVERKKVTNVEQKIVTTPVTGSKQKRMISGNTPKNGYVVNKDQDDSSEEALIDMYKHVKISSAVKNTTPGREDKQRRVNFESTPKNVEFISNNESNSEEECPTDTYKRIKTSSVKKNISVSQRKNNARRNIEIQLEGTILNTPKSRSLKLKNLTPSMGKRNSTLMKPSTPLQEARSRLHVSAVPKSLPCREEEFNNIFTFLKGKLEDKSGGCIYISGVPGTGKTATVNEAVRCLRKLTSKGQLDDFDYVAINGMKLTEPRQSYVQILKQLGGKTVTWEQAYRVLEKRFHNVNSKMTLLLVDELDFLCTKRQDVVYNLLDWPTKATAQLIVVTIANTMDLPERVLMGRVTSRLGLTRLTFQPYNYKQLQEIVMSRLKEFDGFRSEAVQLVARKVSAVSGDARRALDICRRAMEIAESRNAETISLQDVTEAVSEMIASAKVQAIKHCSKMEQIFLQSISAEVTRTSIEEVYFKDAYKQLESLCSFDGIEIPTVSETLAICGRLGASRLLICEHSRNDIYQKILLNVSIDDIHYAIQELDFNSK
ncbi:PREDICTED: origin recognition complex subunit 1 [Dufourea novaeangliae]|uniref:Origin recognition complex subunit 1 n=1 Tax=Dufourea novaeangliae TaxID=178035 RepID=A0A154PF78_DUFNO|nr:PREDICTED: origin recognition complex subunit 1 [Dufourea novaeangliae]KZC10501.1 Origin recognition complex subunit 1 [Dufourea novaeangliae]